MYSSLQQNSALTSSRLELAWSHGVPTLLLLLDGIREVNVCWILCRGSSVESFAVVLGLHRRPIALERNCVKQAQCLSSGG